MKRTVSRAQALSDFCRISKRAPRSARPAKACNLCTRVFIPRGRFHLFCDDCRSGDELFKFHDWLLAPT